MGAKGLSCQGSPGWQLPVILMALEMSRERRGQWVPATVASYPHVAKRIQEAVV